MSRLHFTSVFLQSVISVQGHRFPPFPLLFFRLRVSFVTECILACFWLIYLNFLYTSRSYGAGAFIEATNTPSIRPSQSMFKLNSGSIDRKPSTAGNKGGIRAIASRLKPELRLAVDTDVSRHQGSVPEQVFPYETKPQRRSVGQTASILSQRRKAKPTGLRSQLENRDGVQAGIIRSDSVNRGVKPSYIGLPPRPDINKHVYAGDIDESGNTLSAPALHNRVKGLRPSPLNLVDVSPSDRAIPIGIAIPSARLSDHTNSPLTATPRTYSPPHHGQEAVTPTIIVTPAKEDFDLEPPQYLSLKNHNHSVASSIYSRYTNCVPRTAEFAATPPVPPLPLFAQNVRKQTVPESKLPTYEESRSATSHKATLSVCTVFEEDEQLQPPTSARSFSDFKSRALKRQSTLLTPRRSRGWWNVITSPFSARSNGLFWKSPTDESVDRAAILNDASAMGVTDTPYNASKEVDDLEPQSAPATRLCAVPGSESRSVPKRSITAPGALDPSADVMNIYRIPSQGAAAAYYDQTRHFPSLLIDPQDAVPRSMFEDDSPLTDVCACERHRHGNATDRAIVAESDDVKRASCCSERSSAPIVGVGAVVADNLKSPFDDSHAIENREKSPPVPQRALFTSPTADELLSPSPISPTPARDQPKAVSDSRTSIETMTPVVENAHVGTVVGPRSSNGEQREVIIPPSREPSPPIGATKVQEDAAVSRSVDPADAVHEPVQTTRNFQARPPMHSREGSHGLGITSNEHDLFPPPKMISEKPRLGTDRFGQLVIVKEKEQRPTRPWYRRFFWMLVTALISLLLLLVVLLVILIPQTHADNAVQAQWLNLTGFPPLPTGVATVIQPKKSVDQNKCIDPPSLWSCAMPPAKSTSNSESDLSNFRLEIRFRNHTLDNTTAVVPIANYSSSSGPAAVRSQLRARSTWSRMLYSSTPAPPSEEDQLAIGSTTDNNSLPYNGEETPFYLSLLNPEPLPSLNKRDTPQKPTSAKTQIANPYPYPHPSNTTTTKKPASVSTSIPKPLLLANGRPDGPLLYPYVTAQPLRLYNRGQDDEHYGFYTYFSKTVFVANASSASASKIQTRQTSPLNETLTTATSSAAKAQAFCSFVQTRLHVRIGTKRFVGPGLVSHTRAHLTLDGGIPAASSSANDMQAPGSFPYAVSVSLDREAGPEGEDGKGVFCWALDGDGKVVGEGVKVDEAAVAKDVEKREESGSCGCEWDS